MQRVPVIINTFLWGNRYLEEFMYHNKYLIPAKTKSGISLLDLSITSNDRSFCCPIINAYTIDNTKIDHSGMDARIVLEQNKIQQKSYL